MDDALRRILETSSLADDKDRPLDMDAARAEQEFWSVSRDEPEEDRR